ncbi:hypothetical protein FXB41_09130 [Bradyrhizobium canariense]|nr:hypothetical protein [Bradyrhizobium canariense]
MLTRSPKDLGMHRQRLVVDLKAWEGFDCRLAIAQIEQDIAAIDTGWRRFRGLKPVRLTGQPGGGECARRTSAAIFHHDCPRTGLGILVRAQPDVGGDHR